MPAVEVFADVGCPFTHVGLRRFVASRNARDRDDVRLLVRSWPLELVNDRPLDPHHIEEEVDELRGGVASDLFTGFDRRSFPSSSLPAMALAAAAYDRDLDSGEAVSLELRDRLFERGEDIADPGVLDAVARAYDLSGIDITEQAAVRQDWAEGTRRGVIGSPHFFTPSGAFFCPTLAIRRVDGQLEITGDPEAFEQFVADCLR